MTARKPRPGPAIRPTEPRPTEPQGPPGGGYTKWVLVTPEIASEWLERNHINRALRDSTAQKMAEAMADDMWGLNPQVIIIDWNKELCDGQHRLWAIVISGKTQWLQVTFDVDPICRDYIDTGRAKTVGDLLKMAEVPEPNSVAAVAKLTWAYQNRPDGLWNSSNYPDKTYFRALGKEHQELMGQGVNLGKQIEAHINLVPRGIETAMYLIVRDSEHIVTMLPEFVRGIKEGTNLNTGDPRLALIRIGGLKNNKKIDWDTGAAPVEQQAVALMIKAWNLWVAHKTVTFLRWHSRDLPMPRAR